MKNKLVIIGASGHGKVVADIAGRVGYSDISFLDDNPQVKACIHYPVVGDSRRFKDYECDMVVAVGNSVIRQRIQNELEQAGKRVVTLVHPDAVIANTATIEAGSVVMAGAVINADSVIGKGCIINTCASVDHDCTIGDYVHISVGTHLAGTVQVGERSFIGAGVTVINNIDICSGCIIGAGATVIKNIKERGIYVGMPMRKIKARDVNGKMGGGIIPRIENCGYAASRRYEVAE